MALDVETCCGRRSGPTRSVGRRPAVEPLRFLRSRRRSGWCDASARLFLRRPAPAYHQAEVQKAGRKTRSPAPGAACESAPGLRPWRPGAGPGRPGPRPRCPRRATDASACQRCARTRGVLARTHRARRRRRRSPTCTPSDRGRPGGDRRRRADLVLGAIRSGRSSTGRPEAEPWPLPQEACSACRRWWRRCSPAARTGSRAAGAGSSNADPG